MCVLNLSHCQRIALVTVHHDWYSGVVCNSGVVGRIGVFYVDDFFFVGGLSDGGKMAITFVDGIVFDGDGRIDIFVELLYI